MSSGQIYFFPPPKITKNWLPPVGDPRFAVDSSHCPCAKASCRILSKGGMSERAKARVGCLLIENTGRWRGLYAGEVPKARWSFVTSIATQ